MELFSFSSFSSAIATIIRCCFILCFVHHHLRLIVLVYYYQKSNTVIPGSSLSPFFCVSVIKFVLFFCFVTFLTVSSIYSSLKKRKEVSSRPFLHSLLLRKKGEDAKQRQQQSTAPLFLPHRPHSSHGVVVVVVRIFRLHTTNERAMAHVWEKSRSV